MKTNIELSLSAATSILPDYIHSQNDVSHVIALLVCLCAAATVVQKCSSVIVNTIWV